MQNRRAAILKQPVGEFGLALASVVVATLFRLPLTSLLGNQVPFITFFPAIVLGAWFGGWRGGLTATSLSGLIAVYLLIPPRYSLLIVSTADQLSLCVFIFVGVCLQWGIYNGSGSTNSYVARRATDCY